MNLQMSLAWLTMMTANRDKAKQLVCRFYNLFSFQFCNSYRKFILIEIFNIPNQVKTLNHIFMEILFEYNEVHLKAIYRQSVC